MDAMVSQEHVFWLVRVCEFRHVRGMIVRGGGTHHTFGGSAGL